MSRERPPARSLPSVDRLVHAAGTYPLPRVLIVRSAREVIARARRSSRGGGIDALLAALRSRLESLVRSRLQPVINATGVVAHTNLGRAPLAANAVEALASLAGGYSNLEFDLESGERGGRAAYLEGCLAELCAAPAATVVNNCAAALVLVLHHLTRGPRKQVVISRGELVQIGGGFRIPEILAATGARLVEVGTTNRTRLDDYARALGDTTALILRVHRSNFVMQGFVETPDPASLVQIARRHRVPVIDDLGSGAVWETRAIAGAADEPEPRASLAAGVEAACFSGDKLFGGPQAGIIAGTRRLVGALKADPLFRALRCDKLALMALQATTESHLDALQRGRVRPCPSVPVPALLHIDPSTLQERAIRLRAALGTWPGTVEIGPATSRIGGGVAPLSAVPSVAIRLQRDGLGPDELARRLRLGHPPVVAIVRDGWVHLDLRTVLPAQDAPLVEALRAVARTPDTNPRG